MKKTTFAVLIILMISTLLFAQGTREEGIVYATEEVPVHILALKGPTGMGLSKLMHDSLAGPVDHNSYTFTIAGSPHDVAPAIIKGDADIAAAPANMASVLYNNTGGKVKVLAVNTLGVIYITEIGDSVHSIEDLKGKTIYASGKGATPEYALNILLESKGLDPVKDVNVEWKSQHAECLAAVNQNHDAVAMLPQPFVTTGMMKNPEMRIAVDFTKEWAEAYEGSEMITGVVIAKTKFVEEHPNAVNRFLESYKESVEFVNRDVDSAAEMIGEAGIIPAKIARNAIPKCNIVCITGDEMKQKLSGYLAKLYEQNPKATGNALPDDQFYYTAN